MQLEDTQILHVARLARLRLTEAEIGPVREDLNRVLTYVSKLQELNLDDVEPTMHVVRTKAPVREDRVEASLSNQQATANGPSVREGMFAVPRIIEGGADDE